MVGAAFGGFAKQALKGEKQCRRLETKEQKYTLKFIYHFLIPFLFLLSSSLSLFLLRESLSKYPRLALNV